MFKFSSLSHHPLFRSSMTRCGYPIWQHRQSTFPFSQKVLLDLTALVIDLDDLICTGKRKSWERRSIESIRLPGSVPVIYSTWSPVGRRISARKQNACFHEGLCRSWSTGCSVLRLSQQKIWPRSQGLEHFSYFTVGCGLALAPWGRRDDPVGIFEVHGK